MFSYGIWEGGRGSYLIAEYTCAVTKKNYGKEFFPLVWNFDHENLAIVIW